jgi:metal-sulfur cluster biosynthetic enzyme
VTPAAELAGRVGDALRLVLDPELGENIVDLGLIYDITVTGDGVVHITMTTTTPGCPATAVLRGGVRDCARAVPGVADADVLLTYDPPWTPARMSEEARTRLRNPQSDGW